MTQHNPIGIDLGTSYGRVAVFRDGKPEIIPNSRGENRTPAWVAFSDDEILIGTFGTPGGYANTVFNAKRLIGRQFSDPVVQSGMKHWPFKITAGPGNKPLIEVEHENTTKTFLPEQISGMVLGCLKSAAEAHLEEEIKQAVITVPACFNESQRKAVKDAAGCVGLGVLGLVDDGTAAATSYAADKMGSGKKNVLLFDLGGGFCSATLVAMNGSDFQVKAAASNPSLGGEDFTSRVFDACWTQFTKAAAIRGEPDPRCKGRLRSISEQGKVEITSTSKGYTFEADSLKDGKDFVWQGRTNADFQRWSADLLEKCLEPVTSVLKDAQMQPAQIDEVVLVGNSCRVGLVEKKLTDFFNGKQADRSILLDEAVVSGAAMQAANISGRTSR